MQSLQIVFKSDSGRVDVFRNVETNLSEKFVEVFCNAFQTFHVFVWAQIYDDVFCKSRFQEKLSYTSAQSNNDKNDNKQ